jgi:hypothetical protein
MFKNFFMHIWKDREGPNIDFNKIPSMIFILFDGILASLFRQHFSFSLLLLLLFFWKRKIFTRHCASDFVNSNE